MSEIENKSSETGNQNVNEYDGNYKSEGSDGKEVCKTNNKSYEINKNRVVEFIAENSRSDPIQVEMKSTCCNLKMNSGAYHILIIKNFVHLKEEEFIQVEKEKVICVRNEARFDKNEHVVEHLMYFETSTGYKANAHFYHTKQKITIQGPNFEIVSKILERHFKSNIDKINNDISEANRVFKFGTIVSKERGNPGKPTNKRKRTDKSEPKLECDLCDQEFYWSRTLINHKLKKHSKSNDIPRQQPSGHAKGLLL